MNVRKRGLALLMCVCMIFTLLPFSVFAEDGADTTEQYVSDNSQNADQSGVSMTKTVTKVDDDTYTVTLEQYVKDTINAGKTTPVDVVLVLDVSGSMAESGITSTEYQKVFNVNSYTDYYINDGTDYVKVSWCRYCQAYAEANRYIHSTTYTPKTSESDADETHVQFYTRTEGAATTKLDALKNAVNSFIGTIADKNKDSKIAIVKFAGDKTDKIGNDTYGAGRYTYNYTQIVKELTAVDSEENVQELKAAVNALTSGGATQADYGMEKAKTVFGTGTAPADRQRVVIMFTDGEPTSSSGFETSVADKTISAANVLKNSYGAKVYTIAVHENAKVGTELPDNSGNDRINRYMHLVSSNYPNAESLTSTGEGSVEGGYYKVATSEAELSDAFTKIGDDTSEAAVKGLDGTAVLTDNLAKNFMLPDGAEASDIKVYTAAYNGDGTYADRAEFDGANVSIGKNADNKDYVAVSGFDYSANYVSDIAHQGDAGNFGKKLIVEFTIEVDRSKTYGGTQPTNAGANIKLSDEVYASVADPKVPVAITNGFSCSYTYDKGYDGSGINVKEHFLKMLKDSGLSTKNSKNEYVDITYTITHEENGSTVTDGIYSVSKNASEGSWNDADKNIMTSASVGTYTYTVKCEVTDAYGNAKYAEGVQDGTGTMILTIKPIDGLALDVSGAGYNGVYDGNSHGSAAAATVNGVETDKATILYSTDNGNTWTPDYPTATNVSDSTTVKVKASLPGYNDAEAEYSLTVSQRPVTFTASTVTRTWTGAEITVNNTDDSDVTITASAPTAEAPKAGLLQDNDYSFEGTVYTASGTDETTGQGNAGQFVSDAAAKLTIKDGQGSDVTANYAPEFVVGYLKITAPGSAETVLKAVKNYDDKPAESAYTFELKNDVNEVLQTKQNAADGTVTFDALTFDKKGTYTYYISEVSGADKGVVYDKTVYAAVVTVTLPGSSYAASTAYYKLADNSEQEPVEAAVFNNTTAPATLVVGKTVSGNVSTSTEFGFRVELADKTYNGGGFTDGAISFTLKAGESKSLSLPGNAAYTVKELDSAGYTVTATLNGEAQTVTDGALSGTAAAGETVTVSFNNYKAFPPAPKTVLTITAGSAEGYGPDAITCDKWTADGLKDGDTVASVTITGKQSVPGSSANVASGAVIRNAAGKDVTANYDIKYVDGTLTMIEILNKEVHFNYIIGYTDGTIRPDNNISRAEVATIFFRLLNDDVRDKVMTTDCDFSDVAEGSWCRRAIATLNSLGIIKGYTDGTFRPNAEITRAELATIISRFADLDVNTKTFSDISGHWAQKYIELAAGNGWINGYKDGTFRPDEKIIRSETFAMINRVLGRVTENVSDLLPQSDMNMWSDNMDEDAWYYKDVQEATNYHKCERVGESVYEKWTEKVPDIDWAKYQL